MINIQYYLQTYGKTTELCNLFHLFYDCLHQDTASILYCTNA